MYKISALILLLLSPCVIAEDATIPEEVPAEEVVPEVYVPPSITINGKTIKSFSTKDEADKASLLIPESLRNPKMRAKLKNEVHITPFAHNPQTGSSYAPIEIIEFMDLSCGDVCTNLMEKLSKLQERHPKKVRLINIYMPAQPELNMVNFYAKVAAETGVFWPFREKILAENITESAVALETLLTLDVPHEKIRLATRREAGKIYRQLDKDRILSEKLRLAKPPHLFINGIHVGEGGIPVENLEDVILYILMDMKKHAAKF